MASNSAQGLPVLLDRMVPSTIGPYVIQDIIGTGGFAQVYLANRGVESVAIKVIPRTGFRSISDFERFEREVESMTVLNYDHIVRIRELLSDRNFYYLAMEFCAGGNLLSHVSAKGALDEPTAALVFKQLVSAVAACHTRGVAHRDLKLENVLITEFPVIKLSDFGMCGYMEGDALLSTLCGTICYCAPEVFAGSGYAGQAADVWSLGVALYVMITRSYPWPVGNETATREAIQNANFVMPGALSAPGKQLLQSMLQVDPADRMTVPAILGHPWLSVAHNIASPIHARLDESCRVLAKMLEEGQIRPMRAKLERMPCVTPPAMMLTIAAPQPGQLFKGPPVRVRRLSIKGFKTPPSSLQRAALVRRFSTATATPVIEELEK
jgi:serine/threonine protein kinase